MYAKNSEQLHFNLLDRTAEMDGRYKNPDNDPRGAWQSGDLVANEVRTNGNYDVIGPTGKVFNVPEGKHWVYSEENMKALIAENRIWFGKDGTSFPRKKGIYQKYSKEELLILGGQAMKLDIIKKVLEN